MMEKGKKEYRWFFRILTVLFILFLCLYTVSTNGYLQKINENKSLFTEEQIKQFERDVESGEYVDINDYILPEQVDYSNPYSKLGEDLSELIQYSANKSIALFQELFSFLFK